MNDTINLSDAALAVLAFAAYHQLQSGQAVTKVIREDGAGHKANEDAVRELEHRKLVEIDGNDIVFSAEGLGMLSRAVEGLRQAARNG